MNEKIQLTEELITLLEKCKKPKEQTRKELESLWLNKFQPNCQKMLQLIINERNLHPELSDSLFFKKIIYDFLSSFIPIVCTEYGPYISDEKLQKFLGLLNEKNIILINDPTVEHDFSANSELGQITINEAQFNKEEDHYLERSLVRTLGNLPHESFHFLINMLKKEEQARMIYHLNTGETVHFPPGKVGQILSEGFVEKYASDFCERHGIFYTIDPSYAPFVNLCSYFQNENSNIDDNCIFNSNYETIFESLSENALKSYEETERLTMLMHFQVKEYQGLKDKQGKKIMINPSMVISSYTEKLNLSNLDFTK